MSLPVLQLKQQIPPSGSAGLGSRAEQGAPTGVGGWETDAAVSPDPSETGSQAPCGVGVNASKASTQPARPRPRGTGPAGQCPAVTSTLQVQMLTMAPGRLVTRQVRWSRAQALLSTSLHVYGHKKEESSGTVHSMGEPREH